MENNIIVSGDNYANDKIVSGSLVMVQSLDGDELQYDTMQVTVNAGALADTSFMPSDADGFQTADYELLTVGPRIVVLVTDPSLYRYGAEVIYRRGENLVGKYYISKVTRVGKTQYKIECMSPIGLLAGARHYGGIYLNGIAFQDLISDIIGGIVPFSVAPELQNQIVYGWLPVATRRDNLHQALFAMVVLARKDENGDLLFAPLSDETHSEVLDDRIFMGGSVKYPDAATKVAVSEHAYYQTTADEAVTLFEGLVESASITTPSGSVVQGALILFEGPMHDLSIENGEILESGVNYAVLAPAAECKLTGQKYTHTVRQITRPEASLARTNETDNEITVTDATLVSIANSENVADRLMSYYSSAKTITTDIVVDAERAGSAVRFTDPFGDVTNGIIKSLDITMSNTLRGRAEIVADYSPGGAGNYYTHVDVISADGKWTVPDGVEKIRIVLIGGGTGGWSGASGEPGGDTEYIYSVASGSYDKKDGGAGGKGGAAGTGGSGGKILVASFHVEAGTVFPVSVGSGGPGGVCTGTENAPGAEGTDTTFGDYSSANGTRSATGYADLFGSTTYGLPGIVGVNGADGVGYSSDGVVGGESITIGGVTYVCGATGEGKDAYWPRPDGVVGGTTVSNGGYGGGAAYGANGENGMDATSERGGNYIIGYPGNGGNGASAASPGEVGPQYGAGGQGGHGGGGGGGGGGAACIGLNAIAEESKGGLGGLGSNGGQGAQGCVLVYY